MSRIVLVVSLGFAALCAWTAPSRASFVFAGEGLARNCYLIAEYGYGTGSKEVTPLDVCDAALAETIDTEARAGTLVNRFIVKLRMGLTAGAVTDCRTAVRIAPNMGEAHANLGISLMKQGKFDEALPALNKGIELGVNKMHVAYYNRGMLYEAKKDVKNAYLDYKKAVELVPDFQPALEELKRFSVAPKPAS